MENHLRFFTKLNSFPFSNSLIIFSFEKRISPSVGLYKRSKARPVVGDFPEPDSPTETIFALRNLKEISCFPTAFSSDRNTVLSVLLLPVFLFFCISHAPVLFCKKEVSSLRFLQEQVLLGTRIQEPCCCKMCWTR